MKRGIAIGVALIAGAFGLTALAAPTVSANHGWGTYHWARTSNPFTVKLGDNVASAWDPYLAEASVDWTASAVLDTAIVDGKSDRRCRATSGQVEVCAAKYGFNGWLGLASIWISGDHITQGTVKLNDSYFNTATYNTPPWRRSVMCQEIGHTFGLSHQDEDFNNWNLGSCMDYTGRPAGSISTGEPSNEHPNTHDFDQLAAIYEHVDSTTTLAAATANGNPNRGDASEPRGALQDQGPDDPADFGRPVGPKDGFGRDILFVRDLGPGNQLFTWVKWAHPGQPGAPARSR